MELPCGRAIHQFDSEVGGGASGYFGGRGAALLLLDGIERRVLQLLQIGQRHQRRDQPRQINIHARHDTGARG